MAGRTDAPRDAPPQRTVSTGSSGRLAVLSAAHRRRTAITLFASIIYDTEVARRAAIICGRRRSTNTLPREKLNRINKSARYGTNCSLHLSSKRRDTIRDHSSCSRLQTDYLISSQTKLYTSETSISVFLTVGPKCTLAASHAAPC